MPSDDDLKQVAKSLDRIARLLAGVLLKDDESPEQAPRAKGEQQRKCGIVTVCAHSSPI